MFVVVASLAARLHVVPLSLQHTHSVVASWASEAAPGGRQRALRRSMELYDVPETRNLGCVAAVDADDRVRAVALVERVQVEGQQPTEEEDDLSIPLAHRLVLWDLSCNDLSSGSKLMRAFAQVPAYQPGRSLDARWRTAAAFYGESSSVRMDDPLDQDDNKHHNLP